MVVTITCNSWPHSSPRALLFDLPVTVPKIYAASTREPMNNSSDLVVSDLCNGLKLCRGLEMVEMGETRPPMVGDPIEPSSTAVGAHHPLMGGSAAENVIASDMLIRVGSS
jgi:hypothetical protein